MSDPNSLKMLKGRMTKARNTDHTLSPEECTLSPRELDLCIEAIDRSIAVEELVSGLEMAFNAPIEVLRRGKLAGH